MSRNWTPQQKNAIYATDGSVLVSAAAGSGKTAVLVERVIKLITREKNPLDVDRLLIVTFTRAAAAEMRERIQAAVNKLLEDDPYNAHLLAQRQLLYSANISTIDSFCGDIVREYFHTLDVARDFRIADEGELEILRQEALDNTFESFYDSEDDCFYSLLDLFKGKQGDQKLRETVLKISEFLTTQPFPDKWLDDMLENYSETDIEKTVWGKIIIDYALSAVLHGINLTENSILRLKDDEKLQDAVEPLLVGDLAYFTLVQLKFVSSSWDEIRQAIFSFETGRMKSPKGYKDNPIKISVSSNRDEVKETVKKLQSLFFWSEEDARLELSQLHRFISTLFTLVRAYDKKLSELKAKKNILSFADIESLTVKLLAKPDDENVIIGAICLNSDITESVKFENYLRQVNNYDFNQEAENEIFATDVQQLLDELIKQALRLCAKSPELMTREDKMAFIKYLDEKGVFIITKSSERVCEQLNISKYTFYHYLDLVRKESVPREESVE